MLKPCQLTEEVSMRVLRPSDAPALAAAYIRNREYLSSWEPVRADEYYSEAWQAAEINKRFESAEAGEGFSLGLFAANSIIGRFNLAGIVRGPFQSAGLGYWVDGQYAGRGLASAAVLSIVKAARDELGLHRIEASTLLHNIGSQRVLLKAGFQHVGMAPRYLKIAGTWQDHNLYQVLLHD
jgi:ribosomal-protein-alanine N-acetyltransferase